MGEGEKLQRNVPLFQYTTFGIGGPADYFFIASTTEELIEAILWGREKQLELFILGSGANILVGDKGFRGLVIKNESSDFHFNGTMLTASSGVKIETLIREAAGRGLSGLEHFAGIPSSLGGAVWQNLHFLGSDRQTTVFIGDIVHSAVIFTPQNREKTVTRDYFHFGYDWSSLHAVKDIVLTTTLVLMPKSTGEINALIEKNLAWRSQKHPDKAWRCSAGSVFKKIEGHGAGRLIDKAGLKGVQIGGARISRQHANFILNTGGATARNVLDLIQLAQKKVQEQSGLLLDTEISLIGEF